jgi:hypothetical protein
MEQIHMARSAHIIGQNELTKVIGNMALSAGKQK